MTLFSPGIVAALVFVLLAAQVTRIVTNGRAPYLVALLLAAAGLIAGELLALGIRFDGPSFGVLHPLPDALATAIVETVGLTIVAPPRRLDSDF